METIWECDSLLTLSSRSSFAQITKTEGTLVNDIHSQLNPTRVHRIARPNSVEAIRTIVRNAREEGRAVSMAGGMHAMGGQQFGTDTILLDVGGLKRVVNFDADRA